MSEVGEAKGPDLKRRLKKIKEWIQRCYLQNLLSGSVTPGPSMAPEKVMTVYIFLLKSLFISSCLKTLLSGSAASCADLE